jgi:hypothetical protein
MRRTDARRRRTVLGESVAADGIAADAVKETGSGLSPARGVRRKKSMRAYLPRARRRHQPKSTDWIPKRPRAVALFLLTLGAMLAGLVVTGWFFGGSPAAPRIEASRFSLHGASSLSVWFSTVLLLASALASLQIRAIREHRSNDYRGTYRIWYWFAAILILGSVNCVVDFDGLASAWLGTVTEGNSGAWLAVIAQVTALTAIIARGAIEVRKSPAALALIVLVWVVYSSSLVLRLPGMENRVVQDDGFTAAGLNVLGTFSLFTGVALYLRFVYLRANGLVKARPKRKKPEASLEPESRARGKGAGKKTTRTSREQDDPAETDRNESAHPARETARPVQPVATNSTAPLAGRLSGLATKPQSTTAPPSSRDSVSDSDSQHRRLDKAERKRLKKLRQQEQSRRAA